MNIVQLSHANGTVSFEVKIPWKDIKTRFTDALKKLAAETKVEGFRKGKAPLAIAEKTIGRERIYDTLITDLISETYRKLLETEHVKPFIQPKIELKKASEDEDWIVHIAIPLEPTITLPDYKQLIADVRAHTKKSDIWVPGKDEKADTSAVEKREKFLNAVLEELLGKTDITLSELIVEEEVKNRLARLVDDVRKIGLTIEAYLQSRQTTQEQLREELTRDIINTYKLEYALQEIGNKENITVEKAELNTFLEKFQDSASRQEAEKNVYMYSAILRKQKIIDFLGSL